MANNAKHNWVGNQGNSKIGEITEVTPFSNHPTETPVYLFKEDQSRIEHDLIINDIEADDYEVSGDLNRRLETKRVEPPKPINNKNNGPQFIPQQNRQQGRPSQHINPRPQVNQMKEADINPNNVGPINNDAPVNNQNPNANTNIIQNARPNVIQNPNVVRNESNILPRQNIPNQQNQQNTSETKTEMVETTNDKTESKLEESKDNKSNTASIDTTDSKFEVPEKPKMAEPMDIDNDTFLIPNALFVVFPKLIRCSIIRQSTLSYVNRLDLFVQATGGRDLLVMSAVRQTCKTPNFHIFNMIGFKGGKLLKESANYIGKVRTNRLSTEGTLFGLELDMPNGISTSPEYMSLRIQPIPGSRSDLHDVEVLLPPITGDVVKPHYPENTDDTLLHHLLLKTPNSMVRLKSKIPQYINGAYRLNFGGRVTVSSTKNFQLFDEKNQEMVLLQFGKVNESCFHLDFSAPFSLYQAFGTVISKMLY